MDVKIQTEKYCVPHTKFHNYGSVANNLTPFEAHAWKVRG